MPAIPMTWPEAHAAQDQIEISGGGDGPFEAPDWNMDQLAVARKALNDLAVLGFDTTYAFGQQGRRPADRPSGRRRRPAGAGCRATAAFYILDSVDENDGKTPHVVTVKDVPVDAFWSITVYNADGYLEANDLGGTATTTSPPSRTRMVLTRSVSAGIPRARTTCRFTEGWNFAVRMYQPREEVLDGSWTFPGVELVK